MDEVRGAAGLRCAGDRPSFTGLVYRQALEHLDGVRDEAATRELIVRENRRYARRQLIWFRKEPNLQWIYGAGRARRDRRRGSVLDVPPIASARRTLVGDAADGPDT